ncbi:sugar kinase [Gallibacterium anatis]|uniref:2-dehydro-3-deoxygluconokinase n=3 Tax=Gallibacterium anatis TaxID=750 RepID=A0A0A2ZYX3_9PAST|nr:sugar kinase [Gallibacterium anatis]KGQ41306.1 ketodeoxygluconokinase [Gallibacterium anatis]KGQ42901.1 ketodeoxygluconokinase [Gallibacterium anatis]KGQ51307.1 ketodeoxygluconokinase [Gallibacterium anatis]KGQ55133.1 ketodeoxygluconokinase [Gallibacterium anatis DSM 16844 = F 149]KGQ55214.1 ketodeoxygluconokinase [Gallibacterium anatis str. Avicor]
MMEKKIAILGECMIELWNDNDCYRQGFAGDTLNTAIYLSRLLGTSAKVSYLSGIGQDDLSRAMINYWQQEGIDTAAVAVVANKQPGLYMIKTDPQGERRFLYWRNDAAARYWLADLSINEIANLLSGYSYLYLSGISLAILPNCDREKLLDAIAQTDITVIFDNNYRPALWENVEITRHIYERMLALSDIAFLTFEDDQALFGFTDYEQSIQQALELGVKEVVVKRGKEPCVIATKSERYQVEATRVEKVVDTTAAGDSFSAGYLAKRLQGGTIVESAQAGHLLAGTVIQHKGAIIPKIAMPSI